MLFYIMTLVGDLIHWVCWMIRLNHRVNSKNIDEYRLQLNAILW